MLLNLIPLFKKRISPVFDVCYLRFVPPASDDGTQSIIIGSITGDFWQRGQYSTPFASFRLDSTLSFAVQSPDGIHFVDMVYQLRGRRRKGENSSPQMPLFTD